MRLKFSNTCFSLAPRSHAVSKGETGQFCPDTDPQPITVGWEHCRNLGKSTPQPYPVPSGFLGLHMFKSYFCEGCLFIVGFRTPCWKAAGSAQAWKGSTYLQEFNGNSVWIVQLGGGKTRGWKIIPEPGVGFPFSHCAVTVKLLKIEHEECTHCQKQRERGVWKRGRHSQAVTKAEGESQGTGLSICAR